MEKQQKDAEAAVSAFSAELTRLQNHLEPLLSSLRAIRTTPDDTLDANVDPLSRARLHITLCYTLNALFCMYLRTQGVDPMTHPVAERLTQVQDAFMRLRRVEAGELGREDKVGRPKRNVHENIAKAHLAAEKLAAVIFPEETELVKALRNTCKRKRFEEEEDEDIKEDDEKETSNGNMETREAEEKTSKSKRRKKTKTSGDSQVKPPMKDGHDVNGHPANTKSGGSAKNDKKKRKRKKKSKTT